MTIEIFLAFIAGAAVMAMMRSRPTIINNPDPTPWLRALHRSGLVFKLKPAPDGEWILSVALPPEVEALRTEAQTLIAEGRQIEAIKLVRQRLDLSYEQAEEFLKPLTAHH